ncbi:hypothetical protein GKKCFE_14950 [Pseudomonas sp. E141]
MVLTNTAIRQAKSRAKNYTLSDFDGLALREYQGYQELALPLFLGR